MGSGIIKPSNAQQIHGPGGQPDGRPSLRYGRTRRLPLRYLTEVRCPSAGRLPRRRPDVSPPKWMPPNRPPDLAPDSHSVWPSAWMTALTGWPAVGDVPSTGIRLVRSALALLPTLYEGGRGSDRPDETAGNGAERGPDATAQ